MLLPCVLSQPQTTKQLQLLKLLSLKLLSVSDCSLRRCCVQYVAWAELLIIQMFAPNVSFAGHLSGILAGEFPPRLLHAAISHRCMLLGIHQLA